jgi:hypothetical protein
MDREQRKKTASDNISKIILELLNENQPRQEVGKAVKNIIEKLINQITIEVLTEINEAKLADKIEREKDKKLTDLILNAFKIKSIFIEQKKCNEYMTKKNEIDKLIKNKVNEYKAKYGINE